MAESQVQTNQEGIGPKLRTLKITEPSAADSSGNAQADLSRHQQVMSLADRRGDLDQGAFENQALDLLNRIADSLDQIRIALS